MSDFLSNFSKDNYQGKETNTDTKEPAREIPQKKQEEESEFELDPDFQKKKIRRYLILLAGCLLVLLVSFLVYRQVNYVTVPDFVGKEVSEVRKWGSENQVKLDIAQEYDFDKEINRIISQARKPERKIKKKSTLKVTASLGANPKDQIELPDFQAMNVETAQAWIAENKAENVSIIENFDETVEKGKFLKMEFANKELDRENYTREDKLALYYSKGAEPRKEDIEVPDFTKKPKTELEEWARKNEVHLELEEVFSESVLQGSVVSQDFAKGREIAKRDVFKASVSLGKPKIVPDFSQYTISEAQEIEKSVPVQVSTIFHSSVPFGNFISQSIGAGATYKEGDDIPLTRVFYSAGRPFMKDLRNAASEGDLQQIFYDEFQSKGADISYETFYVDSSQDKGMVVEMDVYGQYVALNARIRIGISRGNIVPPPPVAPPTSSENQEDE